jgi:hypothetical protein
MNFTNILLTLLTVSSVCEKHSNFEEVYTGNKIKCSKDVKTCPKSIVVKAKNVNRKSTFKFVPATDSKQKLQYTIHVDWCDDYTFDKSLTYVKVRKHTIDGGESIILLLAIIISLMFCCCTPDDKYGSNDNLMLYLMLSNTGGSSSSNWGGANKW